MKASLATLALLLFAAVALSACAPITALNVLAKIGSDYRLEPDVAYGPLDRQALDIYTPPTPAPPNGWPVVVFFYGGSWAHGSRADYRFFGGAMAKRGVLTLVADYRLYPQVRYPDFLDDCAMALAFGLRETQRLGGDPKRVFVMGHSAGAYNASMLVVDPRWLSKTGHRAAELAGWIGLAGPYDFFPTGDPDAQPVFFHPNYPANAQPVEFPLAGTPRAFLGAPVDDKIVSPTRSTRNLAARLETAGVPVTLRMYERPSHQTLMGAFAWPLRWQAPVLDDVIDFIGSTPPLN